MTTNSIVMLKTEQLEHHPNNPRKNIGDITELTASIKKDGILQNLTVVPKPDEAGIYLVVIGNRRLEAAIAAELTELPCVISDMDYNKQLETMLIENINRSDLTPLEEAEGFQQLTLAGFTVKEIHDKTGFSEATINRRLKIAKYNRKKAEEALERGATLADFAKLEQIESKKDREELLKSIGTNNFNMNLKNALNSQTTNKNMKLLRKLLKGKAKELTQKELGDTWSSRCKYESDRANADITLNKPYAEKAVELQGNYEHFYCFRWGDCEFFKLKPVKEKATKDKPAHTEKEKEYERNRRKLNKLAQTCFELRKAFVNSLEDRKTVKDWQKICIEYAMKFAFYEPSMDISISYRFLDRHKLSDQYRTSRDKRFENFCEYYAEHAAGTFIYHIYNAINDNGDRMYHYSCQWEHPKASKNSSLDLLYDFLIALGYEMSDEEQQYRNGTHPLFKK